MFLNPDLATQLAREHQRQMQARASQQRHPRGCPPPRTRGAARITGGLAAAIARAGLIAVHAPGTIWSARPPLPGQPAAAPARTPDRGH